VPVGLWLFSVRCSLECEVQPSRGWLGLEAEAKEEGLGLKLSPVNWCFFSGKCTLKGFCMWRWRPGRKGGGIDAFSAHTLNDGISEICESKKGQALGSLLIWPAWFPVNQQAVHEKARVLELSPNLPCVLGHSKTSGAILVT
jgi:hypothetical protein